MDDRVPRVVIVGGGFGGLAAAKALRKTPARALLIDRTNHHLFQPLLYQVATSVLAVVLVGAGATGVEMAGALAVLIRSTLRSEYRRIDPSAARIVLVDAGKRVLGTFADDLSQAAQERLERLGVEVRLGHGVDQ